MNIYLTAQSSLDVVRYLRSVGTGRIEGTASRSKSLSNAVAGARQLHELDADAERLLSHVEGPIQAYVPDAHHITRTKGLVTRLWSGRVPAGTFINVGHGVCISSPASIFVQLANSLTLAELLAVGMELCGNYSLWSLPPSSVGKVSRRSGRDVTFKLLPAATPARIASYVDRAEGVRGHAAAKRALAWLTGNAASPMETAVYLLLCLSRKEGGYGLPKPTLNPKLTVATPDGKETRYPDLYWEARSIDVEYQSDYAHSGDWSRYRDSRRAVSLIAANVTVVPLTRPQVMDAQEFERFAQGVRKLVGARNRTLAPDWSLHRDELRRALLPSLGSGDALGW